ncbi:metal-dependent hydrolase [Rhodococcus sp. (in: high G+C Gram-positive bacteria)]|uniref:metal-dependent hydrolase n=1 Tax=Rhodococcus sp. TaxID=1831 RepID=UPI003B8A81A4
MVMGPTHAMSGAAAGLAMAAVLPPTWGGPTSVSGAFVFAGVTAGAALLPDLDSPQATIARSFGPASQALAHVVERGSAAIHSATSTRRDDHRENGHRTATHTLAFAFLAGAGVAALVSAFGKPAVLGVLFLMLGLALRGLFPKWVKKNDWLMVTGIAAGLSVLAWVASASVSGPALGAAVTVGVIAHLVGDAGTKMGVPLLAPIVSINGKRWWDVAPPSMLRIKASGPADKILLGAFTVLSVALTYLVLLAPESLGANWA